MRRSNLKDTMVFNDKNKWKQDCYCYLYGTIRSKTKIKRRRNM